MLSSIPFFSWIQRKIYRGKICDRVITLNQIFIFILTYISYTLFRGSRKPFSAVKQVLQGCGNVSVNCTDNGWAPFNDGNHMIYFNTLDTIWASSYAFFMIINSGWIKKVSYQYSQGFGLIFAGATCFAFGLAKYLNITYFQYFALITLVSGFVNANSYSTALGVMHNWFPEKQGIILGLWGTHAYVGNMVAQAIASKFVLHNWALSFIVPGAICSIYGVILFILLIPHPQELYDKSIDEEYMPLKTNDGNTVETSSEPNKDNNAKSAGFFKLLCLPGVIEYSTSVLFGKLVMYTFIFWLPYYIKEMGIKGHVITAKDAGNLAIVFEVGGMLGGLAAGLFSDLSKRYISKHGKNAIICVVMLVLAVLFIFLYQQYGSHSYPITVALLLLTGFFICGPTSLINTAISTDISVSDKIKNVENVASSVNSLINGIGSLGSAVAPLIIHFITKYGWDKLMTFVIISIIISFLTLTRLFIREIREWFQN